MGLLLRAEIAQGMFFVGMSMRMLVDTKSTTRCRMKSASGGVVSMFLFGFLCKSGAHDGTILCLDWGQLQSDTTVPLRSLPTNTAPS